MSAYPQRVPVLVIGAGPTGLTTALLLARYGVDCLVAERNAAPMDIPRAIVVDDEGLRTFQVFGGEGAVLKDALVGDGAAYLGDDGLPFARVGAGPETYGFPKRHFINQPEMEATLRGMLAGAEGAALHYSAEVETLEEASEEAGGGMRAVIRDADGAHEVFADWVVAADGGRSPVRERLGVAMEGSTYEQDWLVVDTLNDPDGDNHSKFYCSGARPHVSIPAPKGGRRYEFMLLPGESRADAESEGFARTLIAPFRELSEADTVRRTVYTFHARIAAQWRAGRILLAGDAAHLTPPFAGQGMNAGLRDAANVSWKLAAVIKGGADPAILDTYEEERRDPAWAMIQLAVAMGDVVMPADPAQAAFRTQLMAALAPFPAARDYLAQMKFKPRPRFDRGLVLGLGRTEFEGAILGEMIPQPDVLAEGGAAPLDALLGPGFALIAQDAAGAAAIAALGRDALCGLPLGKVQIPWAGAAAAPGVASAAAQDDRARLLRAHRDQVLLVRPDRYVAAACAPGALAETLAAWEARLGVAASAVSPSGAATTPSDAAPAPTE